MSATNSTTHYELPVFISSDQPDWMTDFNTAMTKADAAIYANESTADEAKSKADDAKDAADQAVIDAAEAKENAGEWTSPYTILSTDWEQDQLDPSKYDFTITNTSVTVDSILDLYFDAASVAYIENAGNIEVTQEANKIKLQADFDPQQTIIIQAIHVVNIVNP